MSKLTNQKKNDQRPLKALKEKRGNCIEVSLPAFINSSWIHLNAEFKDDHWNTSLSSIFLFFFFSSSLSPPVSPSVKCPQTTFPSLHLCFCSVHACTLFNFSLPFYFPPKFGFHQLPIFANNYQNLSLPLINQL